MTYTTFTSLGQIQDVAIGLMNSHGLGHWNFKFDNAKRRFGCCSWNRFNKMGTISLSKPLCLANMGNVQRITDCILHEIAHAIDVVRHGSSSHGYRWKNICIEIGANPQRCYDASLINKIEGKYKYVCKSCGKVAHAHRRWTRTKACTDCCVKYNNGRFSYDYVLVQSLDNLKV